MRVLRRIERAVLETGRSLAVVPFLILVTGALGCASLASAPRHASDPVTVCVSNQTMQGVVLRVVAPGGDGRALASVEPGRTEVVSIPHERIGTSLTLGARYRGSRVVRPVAHPVRGLAPGDAVRVTLRHNLEGSSLFVLGGSADGSQRGSACR